MIRMVEEMLVEIVISKTAMKPIDPLFMGNQSEEPRLPIVARLIERLERCAVTEDPGAFDANLASVIIEEEKRNLVAEASKLPERLAEAVDRLPSDKRNDLAEIERVLTEGIRAFLVESGMDNPKPPPSSP